MSKVLITNKMVGDIVGLSPDTVRAIRKGRRRDTRGVKQVVEKLRESFAEAKEEVAQIHKGERNLTK
ncbi:hypothetical protein WAF17_20945 [Bernardetia sp. ABR2-2B]|uniref:hypothetical protein n=1 Tax=Bernardetia sp. ABR2-2B TaxID=3127472 RepID=UPI0030CC7C87